MNDPNSFPSCKYWLRTQWSLNPSMYQKTRPISMQLSSIARSFSGVGLLESDLQVLVVYEATA